MSKSKMSPEELQAEVSKFHVLREKRKEEGSKAVAEMLKHPLSVRQAREQVERNHAIADRLDKKESRRTGW